MMKQAWARKNVFSAHREHIYQRISPDPAKHRQVSNVYYALAAVCGLAVLLAADGTPLRLLGGGIIVAGCCVTMALLPRFGAATFPVSAPGYQARFECRYVCG